MLFSHYLLAYRAFTQIKKKHIIMRAKHAGVLLTSLAGVYASCSSSVIRTLSIDDVVVKHRAKNKQPKPICLSERMSGGESRLNFFRQEHPFGCSFYFCTLILPYVYTISIYYHVAIYVFHECFPKAW